MKSNPNRNYLDPIYWLISWLGLNECRGEGRAGCHSGKNTKMTLRLNSAVTDAAVVRNQQRELESGKVKTMAVSCLWCFEIGLLFNNCTISTFTSWVWWINEPRVQYLQFQWSQFQAVESALDGMGNLWLARHIMKIVYGSQKSCRSQFSTQALPVDVVIASPENDFPPVVRLI